MATQIDINQADTIRGIPVDQLYVTDLLLTRPADGSNQEFAAKVVFYMAMKADNGTYFLTGKKREIIVTDVKQLALMLIGYGESDLALADPAIQKGVAAIIRYHCPDLSTAEFVPST